jgi:4-hydroxy-tetrahydrodipicolinate reductase
MNIALIGYGKMGKLLEERLLEKGNNIAAIIDLYVPEGKTVRGSTIFNKIEALAALAEKPDVALEFTRPDMAPGNILYCAGQKIPVVTGTTGWFDRLPEISGVVEKNKSALFWAPNFSLGMNLFYRVAEYCAEIFDPFDLYDVGGMEVHHNKKADSPSGTAKAIAEKMLAKMTRKKKAVYQMLDRPPEPEELHFASLRVGSVQGVHSVTFDSPADTVEIVHTLRSREGLVAGAMLAADWLCAQKKDGVFTMDDMLADILERRN